MTAQIPDAIVIDGVEQMLFAEPLSAWFAHAPRPNFIPESTANWRGYRARWEIRAGRLHLTGLTARVCMLPLAPDRCQDHARAISVADLFPGRTDVFADWFTGTLRVPVGAQISYRHMGYESVYAFDLMLEIVGGEVVRMRTIDNRPAGGGGN